MTKEEHYLKKLERELQRYEFKEREERDRHNEDGAETCFQRTDI